MFNTIKIYWIVAWVFVLIFGEILPGVISRNPVFFEHWFAISVYYAVITLIAGILFYKIRLWLVLLVIFLYGGFAEVLFFKGIRIFPAAGAFYVFLFYAPYLISKVLGRRLVTRKQD